jgi:uncharacterized cupredoxin-like copper-binding protein
MFGLREEAVNERKPPMNLRQIRHLALASAALLALAACGGSDTAESVASDVVAAATVAPPAETPAPAPAETPAPAPDASEAPVESAAAPETAAPADTAAASGEVTVITAELDEWTVVLSGPVPAGMVQFDVTNIGEFPHELVILSGKYDEMAQDDTKAVIVDQLAPGQLLDEVETLAPGESGTVTLEMAPGHYSLLCNIAFGGSSHVGRGQIVEIDVV